MLEEVKLAWFGDECGIEGDPRPRRRWAKRGSRPRVPDLPPYSPDLNPIEILWKVLKDRFFSDWYAKTLEQLEERVCASYTKK